MKGASPLGGLVQISTDLYYRSALLQMYSRGGGVLTDYSLAMLARQHKEFIVLAFPNTAKLLPATDTVGIHSIQETVAWCLRVKKEDKLSVMVWTAVCTFNEGGYDLQCILRC